MSRINQHQREYKDQLEKEKVPLGKRPDWLKVKLPVGDNYNDIRDLMRRQKLNTVCEEARSSYSVLHSRRFGPTPQSH